MAERVPAEVFPPGEFLRDELDARGWTQTEFAEILGRPIRLVNEILMGKRGITPQTAKELAAALGTSPAFWLNLESAYQLARTDPVPERISREAKLREKFPVRDMIRRGWLEASESVQVLEAQVKRFFEIGSLEETPRLAHAAKRWASSSGYEELTPLQTAWLFRVKQVASLQQAPAYSELALQRALPRLHELMRNPEDVQRVPEILEECGVRLVVVEPLPGSKIDGACLWLGDTEQLSPVIGLSLRFDRIDNFWFVLRHEIEHVLRRDASIDEDLDPTADAESSPDLSEEELAANVAAAEFCVPQKKLSGFITRLHPFYAEDRVVGFAKLMKVHPGIVIGQLQRRINRYDLLRGHLVKIRDVVTNSALTDGYGRVASVVI